MEWEDWILHGLSACNSPAGTDRWVVSLRAERLHSKPSTSRASCLLETNVVGIGLSPLLSFVVGEAGRTNRHGPMECLDAERRCSSGKFQHSISGLLEMCKRIALWALHC